MTEVFAFDRHHAPTIGGPEDLQPGLQVVTAPNAGPMTYTGTRTYIIGERDVAIIDPGPSDQTHLGAIVAAVARRPVVAILVTHAHRDHSAGAEVLSRVLGAPVLAHGGRTEARSPLMKSLSDLPGLGGGEGVDLAFKPDLRLEDGGVISGAGWSLQALHTPGHLSDHSSFRWRDAIFTGDLAMGWSTTLISPPDGDLAAFRASIERLRNLEPATLYPGHGGPVSQPDRLLRHLLDHRLDRERQILDALSQGPATIPHLVEKLYAETDPKLHPAAARNVLAHLIDLWDRGAISSDGPFNLTGAFGLR
jgi:glyoxylase-like metal-dependent hydrolase (beta-lactamase superfamily II)